jgi:hypothetical protein
MFPDSTRSGALRSAARQLHAPRPFNPPRAKKLRAAWHHRSLVIEPPLQTTGVAAASSVTLKPDGYHVMLLQAGQLARGEKFSCSIDFQKAGTIETEVEVH